MKLGLEWWRVVSTHCQASSWKRWMIRPLRACGRAVSPYEQTSDTCHRAFAPADIADASPSIYLYRPDPQDTSAFYSVESDCCSFAVGLITPHTVFRSSRWYLSIVHLGSGWRNGLLQALIPGECLELSLAAEMVRKQLTLSATEHDHSPILVGLPWTGKRLHDLPCLCICRVLLAYQFPVADFPAASVTAGALGACHRRHGE